MLGGAPDFNMTDSDASALVIAIGTYENHDALPSAVESAKRLVLELDGRSYEISRKGLLEANDAGEAARQVLRNSNLLTELGAWFSDAPNDKTLVLFWSGHGHLDGDFHYLLTHNSAKTRMTVADAIDVTGLGPIVANSNAEKILVLLDACFSGKGADKFVQALASTLATRAPVPGHSRAFAVIASTHPLQKAREGVFCDAFRSVLLDPSARRSWSDEDRLIHSDSLAEAVAEAVGDLQEVRYKADGYGQEFIPNPRYRPGLPAEDVETRRRHLAMPDAEAHFLPASKGVTAGETGWYFTGRTNLLRKLVLWLETAPQGMAIVTGPPGAGKSAVMGRLATLSDPACRAAAEKAGVLAMAEEGTIPPIGIVDVTIHAKGKTLHDCITALVEGLGTEMSEEPREVVRSIRNLHRRVTILLDALDEAAPGSAAAIARQLLWSLAALPTVRVLVGTRRSLDGSVVPAEEARHGRLTTALGDEAVIFDLEDEPSTDKDIAAYVRLRLTESAHRGNIDGIARVAEAVAERAGGEFLYARVVARTLQEMPHLNWDLPQKSVGAFEEDLSARFGDDQQRVNDLLAALAWGQGKGLTRRVWAPIASTLAAPGTRYDDHDIAWVLAHAGWHIIETGEEGQAVYRLAHQAFADHYQAHLDRREVHARIVEALTADMRGANWLDADRYLWRHLADHAVFARKLAPLMQDPGYLAVADPARLLAALRSMRETATRPFAEIYTRVVGQLKDVEPIERMAYIHMAAQQMAPKLAASLEPPVRTRWLCHWARIRPSTPYQVVGERSADIWSVAAGEVDGRAVVVSNGWDRTVRLWDAVSGAPIGAPLKGHEDAVSSVALGEIDGRSVVVSGSRDKTVRLWDAASGAPIGAPLAGHEGWVLSVALGEVDGRAVVVSASDDRTVRLWDAVSSAPIGVPLTGHERWVKSVVLGEVDGRAVVISGSVDKTIRLWDAVSGALIGAPLTGHESWVDSVAFGKVDGRAVVATGSWDQTIRLWDAASGAPLGAPLKGHEDAVLSVALGEFDGHAVVISGSMDKTVRLWDAASHTNLLEVNLGLDVAAVSSLCDCSFAIAYLRGVALYEFALK